VDLFTHVLLGYLLAVGVVGFQPQYLAAAAIAGGLPDGDIFFFPLARRFPILRHHGITHSIFGVTVLAAIGGLVVAPRLAAGDPWTYFAVMELAGLGHMVGDGFTHFSVPPFLPFSERRLELDADRAINFVLLAVSVTSFYLLLGVERNQVPFPVYAGTVYALIAFYASYLAIRLAARLWIGRHLTAMGPFRVPIPTTNPFRWLLIAEEKSGGRVRTTFAPYTLGRGLRGPVRSVDVPAEAAPDAPMGPVATADEALARTYPIARRSSGLLDDTYHFGEATRSADGGWIATWYSLEFTLLGRAAGVRVVVAPDGSTQVRRSWAVPGWQRTVA